MTPLEQLVATVWHEAFALPPDGVDEDFFATGGHSLLAAELAARLQELSGVEVPLTIVFDHPTIRAQAAWLAGHATARDLAVVVPASAPAHVARVPASVIAPLVELGRSTMDRDVVVLALLVALHAQTDRLVIGVPAQLVVEVATDGGPSFVELLARTATALGRARATAAGLGPAPAESPQIIAAHAVWSPAGDLELPIAEPALAPVFAALVERIAAAPTRSCIAVVAAPALAYAVEETSAPLSHAQERLWFLEQLQPGTTANHLQQHIRISGRVDHTRLERALHALAIRHAALRTRIAGATGPCQVVAATPMLDHRVVHVSADEVSSIAVAEHARTFDLAGGPLWRSCACVLGPEDHRLYITLHHVIVDALSLHLIFRELVELYGADVEGVPPNLPRLAGSMATLAEWEHSPAGRDRIAADLAYWTQALHGAEPMTLPIDYRRPLVPGVGRHLTTTEIDGTAVATLREIARTHGATMSVALIAATVAFLARLTNRDDLVVVVPAARRDEMSGRGVIGLLLNLIPLRVNVAGDPPFSEIISRTQAAFHEGMRHRDAPFERVVAALGLPREPGRQPLFDVILNIVPGIAPAERAGAVFEIEEGVSSAQPCDLMLNITTRSGARDLTVATRCRDDLFALATAHRLVGRLEVLLHAAIASPATRLSELPLLPSDERELVVETWNRTHVPLPDVTVHAHVCAALARNPDALAVTQHGRMLTARALAQRSAVLAQQLRARGVRPGTRVGVIVPPGPELAIAALGVLRAGGIYVPLDAAQPATRLERLRQEVELVVDLDAVARTEGMSVTAEIDPDVSADAPAYAVFTSGSTGHPKGVETSHRGLVNQIDWFARAFPWQLGEIAVLRSSPAFVDSLWELFGPLAAGVPLAIATTDEMRDARLLAALIEREHISRMIVVPSLLRALLGLGAGRPNYLPTLRLWLATSEELAPALVQQFFAARSSQRLINLYGASETADQVAAYEVTGVDPMRTPIGTPIANSRIYVLDDAQRPVPIGVAGELCAAGVGISNRYLGDSTDSSRVFVPDPFVPGERMYRTGDRGRWRHDGILDFLGRASDLIKVRGVRVEPADVEHALLAHADVAAVAVTVQGERLAAHIVCRHDVALDAPALRRFLRGQLPEPWIPTLMATVPTLPLGPTGKIDRNALPPIPEVASASRAPTGELELAVASEWELILGRRVGADDDFFGAGGESLTAAQLGARLGERFGLDVPLTTLFERPTVAAQAEWLHTALRAIPTSRVTPVAGDRWVAPSFAQERLWFSHSMAPLSPQPMLRLTIHLEGALDPDRLEHAMQHISARHGALRTVFTTRPALAQRVVPTCPRVHRDEDLSGLTPTARDAALHAILAEDRERAFALETGPPWRTYLVKLGPTSHVLVFAVHHLVADGLSLQLWFEELHAFYEHDRPELAPQLVNAADLALWQRRSAGSVAASSAYWRATLAGATPIDLPLRTPRRGWPEGAAGHVREQLGLDVLAQLGALATREEVTMFSVMLAAAYMLVRRITGATDLVVGTIHGGRELPETRGAFGLFLNPLALRCDLAGDPGANEIVRRAGATARAALAHAELPFERVVADINPSRTPFRHPLFDVVLNHHPPAPELRLGGLTAQPVRGVRTSVVPYELMLRTITSSRGLAVQFDFQRDRFDEATVAAWHAEYLALLRDLASGAA